jgi:hypothetical protein
MDYRKTLRWVEPYGGWNENDTGLCNRILHWEIAYEINRNNGYMYKIMLEQLHWPELQLINLPDTSTHINFEYEFGIRYDTQYQRLKFLTVFDVENQNVKLASNISKSIVESIFKNNDFNLITDNHWYSDFGYNEINKLYIKPVEKRPLSFIKLRHTFIEDFLRKNTFDVVGIHIRRNAGVHYTEEDLKTLSPDTKEKYIKYHQETPVKNRIIEYVQDSKYFNIMDNMLKINPEQKFYISTDLPLTMLSNFKKIYGDKIITRNELFGPVRDHLLNGGVDINKLKRGDVIENIIDLFALSFCKFLIKTNNSTWSEFAQEYRNQPSFFVNDNWQTMIRPKYIRPMWGQPGDYDFNGDDLHYEKMAKSLYLEDENNEN